MTDAYRMLVLRLADLEPRSGYQDFSQLPELSWADVLTVMDEDPSIVDEGLANGSLATTVRIYQVLREDHSTRRGPIGVAVELAIECACRTHIFHDVADECASRAIQATGMDPDDYTDLPEEPWVEVEP
jgi:hypothetical protein